MPAKMTALWIATTICATLGIAVVITLRLRCGTLAAIADSCLLLAPLSFLSYRKAASHYLEHALKTRDPARYKAIKADSEARRSAAAERHQQEQERKRLAFESSPEQKAKHQAAQLEIKLRNNELQPVEVDGLVLKAGETCYRTEAARLMSFQTHVTYAGKSGGVSLRIMRNVSVRSGAFRGAPIVDTSLDIQDFGTLNVTSNRLLFIGQKASTEILYAKIASVQCFVDGVVVAPINKKTLTFITDSAYAGIVLQRAMSNDVGAHIEVDHNQTSAVSASTL